MRQVLFRIRVFGRQIPIFGYGVMLFFAFLGSMNLAAWRAKREKLDPELIYDLALWIFIGGLIGARMFYVWQYWGDRVNNIWDVFKIWEGGIVFYGSVLGGTAAFFLYRALRPFPLELVIDVIAPALALGIALGRIGCFLNGCCYGDICQMLPWAVAFPQKSAPWRQQVQTHLIDPSAAQSLPVHPTQLYSSLDGFILLGLLSAFYPLRRRDGEVMALLMVTYPITRFLIEYLRNDEAPFLGGMTISQDLSIVLLACGVLYWLFLSRRRAFRYADAHAAAT